jgi:Fur family peroxide stress response transcriptional regulator
MEREVKVRKTLRKNGLKLTNARKEIYNYLKSTYSHPSAFEVFENVKQKLPGISYATVYNVLNVFARKGVIQELTMDENKKRFDGNPKPHIHLICLKCGKIEDAPIVKGAGLIEAFAQRMGWQIKKFDLNIYGLCNSCRNKNI